MKVFVLWQVGSWVSFVQNAAVLCQVMQNKKLNYDVIISYSPPFDTHYKVVINHVMFDVCTPSSFQEVMTDRHTDRFAIRLAGSADVARSAVISNVGVENITSAGQACFTHRAPV